jgi:tetratricopeptide (TPR) repeat protein
VAVLCSVCLAALLSFAGCGESTRIAEQGPPEVPPVELLEQAEQLNAMARYDEAIELLEGYLEEHPRARLVHFNLGALYGNKGDHIKAAEEFEAELALDPDYPPAYHHLGLSAENRGELETAIRWYRAHVEYDAQDWAPRYRAGRLLAELGRNDEAAEALGQAVALAPREPDPLVELGKIRVAQGDLETARVLFEGAVGLDPSHADATYNLGRLLVRLGEEQQGNELLERFRDLAQRQDRIEHYQQASSLAGSDHMQRFRLGEELLELGRADEALMAFESALLMQPDYWPARVKSGIALMQLQRLEDALAVLEEANRLQQDEFDIHLKLAQVYALLGRRPEARSFVTSASLIRPFSPAETRETAEILFFAGFAEDGWLVLSEGVQRDPRNAGIRFDMARYLHLVRRDDEAYEHYRAAAELEPANPLYGVGWVLIRLDRVGNPQVVVQSLDRYSDREVRAAYDRLRDLPGAERLGELLQDRLGITPR